jgi:hypothetical protein
VNKAEIWSLFERIVHYYPTFSAEDRKAVAWFEVLSKVPYSQAIANLKRYVSDPENKYPPHPGALSVRPGHNPEGHYVPTAEETRRYLEEEQRQLEKIVGQGIPESALERMRQLGYKR